MFRLLLGALFFFSSTVTAFAEEFACTWCRGRGMHYPSPYHNPVSYYQGPLPGAIADAVPGHDGLESMAAISIIYPGLIVMMTMATRYFMRISDSGRVLDEPHFVRNAAGLSALWLFCFYPFLTSALGGFLFFVTGLSCIGGWIVVRRLGFEMRFWERAVVLWSFFFFSLVAGVMAAGYGRDASSVVERSFDLTLVSSNVWGPFMLVAINTGALIWVFRMMGLQAPNDPETLLRLKIYAVIAGVAILDTVVLCNHASAMSWLSRPVLALPSLAYYGAYWVVSRLPAAQRARVSATLFVALAVFLTIVACFATGVSAAFVRMSGSAVALALSVTYALVILWQSNVARKLKEFGSLTGVAFLFVLGWAAARVDALTGDERVSFVFDTLVPAAVSGAAYGALILIYGAGVVFVASRRAGFDARCAVAALLISFMLFAISCADMAGDAVFQVR